MSIVSTSISGIVKETEKQFSEAIIPSPHLDAEVLLAYSLGIERSWLHAHGDEVLQPETAQKFELLVQRRLKREPIAYITGKKEFYGREFIVTPNVLIPRPETETLIELAQATNAPLSSIPLRSPQQRGDTRQQLEPSGVETEDGAEGAKFRMLDMGCGSGCIGITLKLENPELDVTLADISLAALEVARKNAKVLGAQVSCVRSDLLTSFKGSSFDVIVANLPYVDRSWQTSPETAHEPGLALYANDEGLALIYELIKQGEAVVNNKGLLLLEADPEQHARIIKEAQKHGFEPLEIRGYALCFTKQ